MVTPGIIVFDRVGPGPAGIETLRFHIRVRVGIVLRILVCRILDRIVKEIVYQTAKAGPYSEMPQKIDFGEDIACNLIIIVLVVFGTLQVGDRILRVTYPLYTRSGKVPDDIIDWQYRTFPVSIGDRIAFILVVA